MRKLSKLVATTAAILFVGFQVAEAGLVGMPMNLRATYKRIKFDTPTLAPMAYSEFCMRYEDECRTRTMFRGGPVRLTVDRWADLIEVNKSVNTSISGMNWGSPAKPGSLVPIAAIATTMPSPNATSSLIAAGRRGLCC
jgi:predicted transglutaminase-like cysteine proteinase